jgi:hypothetical protein
MDSLHPYGVLLREDQSSDGEVQFIFIWEKATYLRHSTITYSDE